MANSCIVLFCGLPGAGKSTLAVKLLNKLSKALDGNDSFNSRHNDDQIRFMKDHHIMYLCFDEIIPKNVHENFGGQLDRSGQDKTWKIFRKGIIDVVAAFLEKHSAGEVKEYKMMKSKEWVYVYEKIKMRNVCACWEKFMKNERCDSDIMHVVFLDDNMFYSSMRYSYFQLARQYASGFLQIHVTCDRSTLLKQNSERAEPIAVRTIDQMSSVFETPNPQKNEWETNFIGYKSDKDDTEKKLCEIIARIEQCLKNPVPPLEEQDLVAKAKAQEINSASTLQQADQVLRKYIALKMRQYQGLQTPSNVLRSQSLSLNSKRKTFLHDLKTSNEDIKQLDILLKRKNISGAASLQDTQNAFNTTATNSQPPSSEEFDVMVLELFHTFER